MALCDRLGDGPVRGELAAAALFEEVTAVNEATGSSLAFYPALAPFAFHGREAAASQLIAPATKEVIC